MNSEDKKLLEENGWQVFCESPFEIWKEESCATNEAAEIVLVWLKEGGDTGESDE